MTHSMAVNFVEQVNELPRHITDEISAKNGIGAGTRYFKSVHLVDAAAKNPSIQDQIREAYLEYKSSQYTSQFS